MIGTTCPCDIHLSLRTGEGQIRRLHDRVRAVAARVGYDVSATRRLGDTPAAGTNASATPHGDAAIRVRRHVRPATEASLDKQVGHEQ